MSALLWNRLGSTRQVVNSELGTNFQEVGTPTYELCKFTNGFNLVSSGSRTELPNYGSLVNGSAKVTITVIIKYNMVVTNGNAAANKKILGGGGTGSELFDLYHTTTGIFCYYYPTNDGGIYTQISTSQISANIAINDLVLWGLVYDSTASSGNRLIIKYFNLTTGESGTANDNTGAGILVPINWATNAKLTPGIYTFNPSNFPFVGAVFDNLKIYNDAITNFSNDLFHEGFGGQKRRVA